ncbi:protein FAR1-RELATED SEQUENCE 11 isoform X2 [Ziziphus jujuba]|uniref:Protein FAR1-RELATED SEQUENCE n=1 Tax=Ziziphus jujuba TaxID=326968 RepID=A0A6P4AVV9_ZIZJJ|nr:protein FAR1-RELATED SEQUENCE 11 isoform X2 [Ziziphus jujuba]
MSEGTSLIIESSENGTDLSQDDIGTMEETPEDTILSRQTSVNLVPFIGQRFVSQEAAYEYYCTFAKQFGFSIRRNRTRGKDGVGRGVTRRDFTCHRGGYPQMKLSEDGKMQRNRKSSRCGCQAYMRIVKRTHFDVPEWRITGFSNIHNHELLKSNEVCLLPAYSTLSPDDKSRICMFAKAGMSARQMLRLMELEKGVRLGCLPFTEVDIRNLLQSFRNIDRDNDAIDLIAMCKKMKDENSNFKYDFKIDGHNRLQYISWSYASSVQLYEAFGDAVIFDTSHCLDAYDMLVGVWLGVDNHGMTCFFGCVLLREENMQSFSWALKTFLGFMKGKAPQTILTDHNMWLKEAIATEMAQTKHAFCILHIIAKFSDWFSVLLGSRYDEWKAEFHRLYNLDSVEDFEQEWKEMANNYGLNTNKHIISLYTLRTFWALAFLKHYFFAGMMHTSQTNSLADIVEFKDRAGAKQRMQQKGQRFCLKTGSPIESHASSVLTPYAFGKLQEELILAPQYASILVDEDCFQVRHHTQMDGAWKVIWHPCQEHISCSCHLFEFSGILCRHVLRVLSTNNCFRIPDQYLPLRWRGLSSSSTNAFQPMPIREHSRKVQFLESLSSALVAESVQSEEHLDAACEQVSMVVSHIKDLPKAVHGANDIPNDISYNRPSDSLILQEVEDADGIVNFSIGNPHESITLGKLKEKRLGVGDDTSKKRRHCSGLCCGHCGQYGYDASECHIMGGDNLNGEALGYL